MTLKLLAKKIYSVIFCWSDKYLKYLLISGFVAIAAHFIAVFLGLTVPIYSDEIMSKSVRGRYDLDGGAIVGLFSQCEQAFTGVKPSAALYPIVKISSWIFQLFYAGIFPPIILKIIGVISYLIIFLLVAAIIFEVNKKNRFILIIFSITTLSSGVLPWSLILNRGEQFISISILFAIWYYLYNYKKKSIYSDFIWSILITLIAGYLIYSHPKVIYFFPIYLICLSAFITNKWIRLLPIVLSIPMLIDLRNIFRNNLNCPEYPFITNSLTEEQAIRTNPIDMWSQFSFYLFPKNEGVNLIADTGFASSFGSDWLPPIIKITSFEHYINIFYITYYQVIFFVCLIIFLRNIILFVKNKKIEKSSALGLILFAVLILYRCIYKSNTFYEATIFAPLWTICLILSVASLLKDTKKNWGLGLITILVVLPSIASSTLLIQRWTGYYPEWSKGGHVKYQGISTSALNFKAWEKAVIDAAIPCGLEPYKNPPSILVDDITIYLYQRAPKPITLVYFFWWYPKISEPLLVLKTRGSSGAVGYCSNLRTISGIQLIQTGDYCCASKF